MLTVAIAGDFQTLVGYPIPFRDAGHRSLEDYLRSIPDVVRVSGAMLVSRSLPAPRHVPAIPDEPPVKERRRPRGPIRPSVAAGCRGDASGEMTHR